MSFTSIIQILKVNEPRSGTSQNGRPWTMQDCECVLLSDTGEAAQVGVLNLPPSLIKENAPKPGIYLGSFALQANLKDRRIAAILTALNPYKSTPAADAGVAPISAKK